MGYMTFAKRMITNLFKQPVTSSYPVEKRTPLSIDRGHIVNQWEKCVLCGACERACPSGAIRIDRKNRQWIINPYACVQCGACVEQCPMKCLAMDPMYTEPSVEKTEIIHTPPPPKPRPRPVAKPAVKAIPAQKETAKEVVKQDIPATEKTDNTGVLAEMTAEKIKKAPVINDVSKCVLCGMCLRGCAGGALTIDRKNRTWTIDPAACVQCTTCVEHCPKQCLSMNDEYSFTADGDSPGPITFRLPPPKRPVSGKSVPPPAEKTMPPKSMNKNETAPEEKVSTPHKTPVNNDTSQCILCGRCENVCPGKALRTNRKARTWTIDPAACVQCGTCVENCPKKCLSMNEKYILGADDEIPEAISLSVPMPKRTLQPTVKKPEEKTHA